MSDVAHRPLFKYESVFYICIDNNKHFENTKLYILYEKLKKWPALLFPDIWEGPVCNIYHKYSLCPFVLVKSCKTVFHWIIMQDDKNSISSCPLPALIHMNLNKNITRKHELVNSLLTKCILIFVCVYFLYFDTFKKTTATVSTVFWCRVCGCGISEWPGGECCSELQRGFFRVLDYIA